MGFDLKAVQFWLFLLAVFTGCAPSNSISQMEPVETRREMIGKDVQWPEDMLFAPEDLTGSWLDYTFKEYRFYVDDPVQFATTEFTPINHWGAKISATRPKRDKYGNVIRDMNRATQNIYMLDSTSAAEDLFTAEKAYWEAPNRIAGVKLKANTLDLSVETVYTGCHPWSGNVFHSCHAIFLHDQYIIEVRTLVDGQFIALEEWVEFVKVIDVKISAYATQN